MGFTGGFSNTTMNGVLPLIKFSLELADLKSGYGESDTWIMVNKHLYNNAAGIYKKCMLFFSSIKYVIYLTMLETV